MNAIAIQERKQTMIVSVQSFTETSCARIQTVVYGQQLWLRVCAINTMFSAQQKAQTV